MVSVIMPVFNGERYLREAIESVLAQTYADFELLAVDDGSADASLEILEGYAAADGRVRVLRQRNAGVSAARNHGMCEALGEWICFIDCDDLYHPRYLERMVGAAEASVFPYVCCRFEMGYSAPRAPAAVVASGPVELAGPTAFGRLCSQGLGTSPCLKLISAKLVSGRDGTLPVLFDEGMTYGEDLFFCWKACLLAGGACLLPEDLYFYRQVGTSAVSRVHPRLYESYAAAYQGVVDFAQERGVWWPGLEDEVCVSFAQRLPSLLRMAIRERRSLGETIGRLELLIGDARISRALEELYPQVLGASSGLTERQYRHAARHEVGRLYLSALYAELRFQLARRIRGR